MYKSGRITLIVAIFLISSNFALAQGAGNFSTVTVGSSYSRDTPPSNGMIVQGSVGIGTPTPSGTLQMYTSSGDDDGNLTAANGGAFFNLNSSNNYAAVVCYHNGSTIWATGQTGNPSDYRIMVGGANDGTNAVLTATTTGVDIGKGYAGSGTTPPLN